MRAFTNTAEIERDLKDMLLTIRETIEPLDGSAEDHALCGVETFCVIAVKLMRASNPSKARDIARTVEIKARMDGIPVLELRG